MRVEEKRIILWHDCLDCSYLKTPFCPLKGTTELEKVSDRIRQPDDFLCEKFLESSN
ncbi:MAG: hypothetical protein JSV21_07710 [Nitrospirota bacterium]|nr:MAG: hypothetical protein JSV21_07710 [Nitrospirota bacterium]